MTGITLPGSEPPDLPYPSATRECFVRGGGGWGGGGPCVFGMTKKENDVMMRVIVMTAVTVITVVVVVVLMEVVTMIAMLMVVIIVFVESVGAEGSSQCNGLTHAV